MSRLSRIADAIWRVGCSRRSTKPYAVMAQSAPRKWGPVLTAYDRTPRRRAYSGNTKRGWANHSHVTRPTPRRETLGIGGFAVQPYYQYRSLRRFEPWQPRPFWRAGHWARFRRDRTLRRGKAGAAFNERRARTSVQCSVCVTYARLCPGECRQGAMPGRSAFHWGD